MKDAIKPWQIVVVVAALVIVAVSAWFTFGGSEERVTLASRIVMADVRTGELFEFSISGRAVMIPAEHPDTGEITLFPVEKTESGEWVISARDRQALGSVEGETKAVNRNTGVVTVAGESPRRVR